MQDQKVMKQLIAFLAVLFGIATFIGTATLASAQMSAQDSRIYFDFGEQFYAAANQSPDNKYVDIRVNTASAMFSFVRSSTKKDVARGAYYAIRDITIELSEKGNAMPVITRGFKDTIFVGSYELSTAKNYWHAISERVQLPKLDREKEYSMRLEVRDAVLSKLAVRPMTLEFKPRWFNPMAMDSTRIGIGDLQLISHTLGDETVLESRGITYPFSRTITGSYVLALPADAKLDDFTGDIVLRQTANLYTPADTGERTSITLSRANLRPMRGYVLSKEDSQIVLKAIAVGIDSLEGTPYQLAILDFAIPGEQFVQGGYRAFLTVRSNGYERSSSNAISLRWKNMPVALEDPRDAIAPMVHILTDDEFKDMQSGDRAAQFKKLFAYWDRQDPTPTTAFNERLAAFYQRVDYAYFNFASGRILDGAMTDRGKVYILYGPPSSTDRQLLPGESPMEIWTYTNSVRREFRFNDPNAKGDYKLVAMKPL